MGPMIAEEKAQKVEEWVREAVAAGVFLQEDKITGMNRVFPDAL